MGYALAAELACRGAEVILVSGPVNIEPPRNITKFIKINTASQMYDACVAEYPACDAAVMCAAVADYAPAAVAENKIKRDGNSMFIELIPNKDIAKALGQMKRADQKLVGFALETENEVKNAQEKIKKKNFDFIVLNSLNDKGSGFGHDTNKIKIISRDGSETAYNLKLKTEVAKDIIDKLAQIL